MISVLCVLLTESFVRKTLLYHVHQLQAVIALGSSASVHSVTKRKCTVRVVVLIEIIDYNMPLKYKCSLFFLLSVFFPSAQELMFAACKSQFPFHYLKRFVKILMLKSFKLHTDKRPETIFSRYYSTFV